MDKSEASVEIYKHKLLVNKLLNLVIQNLMNRALIHDQSKLEDYEIDLFTEFTPRLSALTYGSDEYNENKKQLDKALKHHYANNRHHPEHFPNGIKDMDLIDLVEMICDWKAATSKHDDGNILISIDKNQERFGYSSDSAQIFKNTVNCLNRKIKWINIVLIVIVSYLK